MSAVQPVAVYALRIPPGDVLIPAVPEFAAMFRVTMAAIDPSEDVPAEDIDNKRPLRATLKVVRITDDMLDEDDSEDDYDIDGGGDPSDDEENGGPSNKKSRKQQLLEALAADQNEDEEMGEDDDDDDEEIDAAEEIKKIIADEKGKGKAIDEDSDEEDEDDDSEESIELDECILCTLDPEKHYQQPIDFVVNEGEKIFFKVSGTHTVHLTGNYVMPLDDGQASLYDEDEDDEDDYAYGDDDEYDLSPDEEELALLENGLDDDESDELDDLPDPRITEIIEEAVVKKLPEAKKGKNKRPADDSGDEDGADLDAIMAKSIKKDEAVNGEPAKPLSKAEKKAAKKLKKNDGEAASTTNAAAAASSDSKKESAPSASDKKVQFAKNIIQGPTPSATPPAKKDEKKDEKKADKSASSNAGVGVRNVQGVTVDDRKVGSGPAAKKGSRLEMRYVGKLQDGKVFDSNKSGTPFKVKVGVGEVIKGWDIGLTGISAGGERRLTIPANLAYGNKAIPGIPKNSTLIFDVKCLSVK